MARVTLRQLEYFVSVYESGSITAAAKQVHISQSAVSTALAELEGTLELQLFIRNRRGLIATIAGRQLLREARQILTDTDDLKNHANELSGSFSGSLTVGCYATLSSFLLPSVIDTFVTSYPSVDLDFVTGSHSALQKRLSDGRCDLALLYDYDFSTDLFSDNLTKVVLQSSPPHVILRDGHPLTRYDEISLEQLQDRPMILFDLPPGGEYFKSLFEMRGLVPFVRFRTTEFELVRSLVARGLGYSILTQQTEIAVSYENRGFVMRPIRDVPRGLNVVAAYPTGARLTRRASAFIEQCVQILSSRTPYP